MPYYVKVTPEVKNQILPEYTKKPKAKDGNYLLFQNDLIGVKGATLKERVDNVGGALLTPSERKAEYDGTVTNPAYCYTPEEYGGEKAQAESEPSTVTSQERSTTVGTQSVRIPQVDVPSDDNIGNDNETQKESEVINE